MPLTGTRAVVFDEENGYLYIIPPELQQCGKSSFHLAEKLVEEGQFSHAILIQQVSQTCNTHVTVTVCVFKLDCHYTAEERACLAFVFTQNFQYFDITTEVSHPSVILQSCVLLKAAFQHSQLVVS